MTWGARYWPIFLIVMLVAFLGPEVYALCTNWQNTLSNWIWTQLRVRAGQPIDQWSALHFLVGGCLVVLFGWLIGHLLFGYWR